MIKKVYKIGSDARKALVKGALFAVDRGNNTLGPSGRNGLLGRQYQDSEMTNDFKTIVEDIYLDDEIEQEGVKSVKEIARATFDKAGDATTTTANLFGAFLNLGMEMLEPANKFTQSEEDPMQVRNRIQASALEIIKELDIEAREVKTFEDMQKVAFGSTENMEHATLIANMFNVIGRDGVIKIEDGYDCIESEVVEGFEIEAGFDKELFANRDDKTFVLENPHVFVTDKSIDFKEQVYPITGLLNKNGINTLIIVADNFSRDALGAFVEAHLSEPMLNIIAIKAPFFNRPEPMKDIADALGAKFFDKELCKDFSGVTMQDFGSTKKITISKDKTLFEKPKGDTKERITEIKALLKKERSKFDQEQLKKRLAKLSGGIGIIRVGSVTQGNAGYLKKKLLNGTNAVKSSLEEGAAIGGGVAFMNIADRLPGNILSECIRSPYKQIQKNAGGLLEIKDTVLDSIVSLKRAVMAASNKAGDILTIEFVNADKYEKPKDFPSDDE